jgi:hypothetical protein
VASLASIVGRLRGSPRAVALVVVLAVAAGVLTDFRITSGGVESRRTEVGYAQAAALVDTIPSQAVDSTAGGAAIAELRNRAILLADLMTRSPLREKIADRAGVPHDHIITQRPMNGLERRLTLKEVTRATVGENDREAYLLRIGVNDLVEGENPIIGIDVRAPDGERAVRMANHAIAELRAYLERSAAPGSRVAAAITVHQLEPAVEGTAIVGPPPIVGVLVAIAVFAIGCAAVLGLRALRGALRRRRLALGT